MKILFAALPIAALLPILPVFAQAPAGSPVLGRWLLQVDKLTTPPETRPKRVELDFRDAGEGRIATHVLIVDQADHVLES